MLSSLYFHLLTAVASTGVAGAKKKRGRKGKNKKLTWRPLTWEDLDMNACASCDEDSDASTVVSVKGNFPTWCLCGTDYECMPHLLSSL